MKTQDKNEIDSKLWAGLSENSGRLLAQLTSLAQIGQPLRLHRLIEKQIPPFFFSKSLGSPNWVPKLGARSELDSELESSWIDDLTIEGKTISKPAIETKTI